MTLFLRDEHVAQCLTMDAMLQAIERMQAHFGRGEAYNLGRRKIIADTGMLSVMGGGLFFDGVLGVKTYTVVRGSYSFQVSLYDAATGKLLCYTQANRARPAAHRRDDGGGGEAPVQRGAGAGWHHRDRRAGADAAAGGIEGA